MESKKKLLIFDWDGTLLNSNRSVIKSHLETIKETNLKHISEEFLKTQLGKPGKLLCEKLCEGTSTSGDTYYEIFSKYYVKNSQYLELFPKTLSMLKHLKNCGFILTIATNKPKKLALPELENTMVISYFSAIEFADQSAAKPNPMMLNKHCDAHKIPHRQALMIGDQMDDVLAGRNANIDSVIVYDTKVQLWHKEIQSTLCSQDQLLDTILQQCLKRRVREIE
ncbi:MAG: HAD family hydrolase [Pseudomonadota bacterium]|nr:HAD family hydrolase [Pseudomonadota bacterium]